MRKAQKGNIRKHMRTVVRTAAALAVLGITPAYAMDYINVHVPDAKVVGEGRLKVLLFDVYDAALYAPGGIWQANGPYALHLKYLRDIEGRKIADRSVEEMRRQGLSDEVKLATWHKQMREIFPAVSEGTELTGVLTQSGQTIFYEDGHEIGRVRDSDFGSAFFGIWLRDNTSAPDLRRKLLGAR